MTRWTDFVRQWAKEHNLSYMCATSKPECSRDYREQYQAVKPTKKQALEQSKVRPAWAVPHRPQTELQNIQVQKIPQPPSRGRTYTEPTFENKSREYEGMALEDRYRAKGQSSVMKPFHIEQEMEPIKSVRMFEKKMKKIRVEGRPEPPSREGIETEHGEAKVVSIQPFAGGDEPFLPPSAVFVPSAVAKINFHTSWLYEPVFPQSALDWVDYKRSSVSGYPVQELDREDKEVQSFWNKYHEVIRKIRGLSSQEAKGQMKLGNEFYHQSIGEKTKEIIEFDVGVMKRIANRLEDRDQRTHLPSSFSVAREMVEDIVVLLRNNTRTDVEPKTGEEIYQEVVAELSGRLEAFKTRKAEEDEIREINKRKTPHEKAMDKYIFETTGYLRRAYEIHKKDGSVIPNEKKIKELKLKLATSFFLPPTWWDDMQDEGPMLK